MRAAGFCSAPALLRGSSKRPRVHESSRTMQHPFTFTAASGGVEMPEMASSCDHDGTGSSCTALDCQPNATVRIATRCVSSVNCHIRHHGIHACRVKSLFRGTAACLRPFAACSEPAQLATLVDIGNHPYHYLELEGGEALHSNPSWTQQIERQHNLFFTRRSRRSTNRCQRPS